MDNQILLAEIRDLLREMRDDTRASMKRQEEMREEFRRTARFQRRAIGCAVGFLLLYTSWWVLAAIQQGSKRQWQVDDVHLAGIDGTVTSAPLEQLATHLGIDRKDRDAYDHVLDRFIARPA